jgi:hypothetical protein
VQREKDLFTHGSTKEDLGKFFASYLSRLKRTRGALALVSAAMKRFVPHSLVNCGSSVRLAGGSAPAADSPKAPIPSLLPRFLHQFVGNGTVFKILKPYEDKFPLLKSFNSVYNVAPASKWGLSIVPLYGVFVGSPPVEKIDANTSGALACTGFVWTVYAMMIQPQNAGSRMLALVNFCMGSVNGYNCYRKYSHDAAKEK